MKAMIFAAGLGTRLGKITEEIPKTLVDINGKSVLQRAVEKCSQSGFNDIIINVHHFADKVEAEVQSLIKLGYKISISDEREKLLETGGGLYKARHFFDDRSFLIYNVDIITDLDLSAFYKYHVGKKGLATLAVRNRPANRVFLVDNSGGISGWKNRSTGEQILTGILAEPLHEIAFSGMHIVKPEIFNFMSDGVYSLTALYLDLAKEHEIYTFREDKGFWFDIGTPDILEEVRKFYST
jgi:N-acetyl-alpha-D-muramate 1-phosphate uridylyltransferase